MRFDQQRDDHLRAHVHPGESVVALGPAGLVTDERIMFAWRLSSPPRADEWTHDSISFDEVIRWSDGLLHDERPILRLEHPPHRRLEWMPAHRFLWFRWGNTTGHVPHEQTTFSFRSHRDPVYLAMKSRLGLRAAVRGEPFVELLPGTREERLGRTVSVATYTTVSGPRRVLTKLWRRLQSLDEHLHHGNVHWWIRVGSWLLLAIPAWLIRPWLVLPAVLVVELAWIAGLQWSWHRDRHRRGRL